MRYLPLALVLLGCSSVDIAQARKNLKAQAEQTANAMLKEDHARMAELTHPTLIDKIGGNAKFVDVLRNVAAQMKAQGFGFTGVSVSEPAEVVVSGDVYGIVPFTLEMTAPGGRKGKQASYLIGVSTDGGGSWKFLDGSGVAGDRRKLESVLPRFPKQIQLPEKQAPVFEKG